jgi:serine/threonine-protein kinase
MDAGAIDGGDEEEFLEGLDLSRAQQALSRPRDVDARTDLWAVGATIFTLLSGHHVHLAESSSEHLVKAATVPARSLAKALPGVPANVEAFVAKALAFSKDDRWPSARAMREELARVRVDPGRRIGTSTFPPPPHLGSAPTFITTPSTPREERSSDPSNISVVNEPRRSAHSSRVWIAGAVLGAALFAGTLGFFAARSTRPAVASTPPPQATTAAPMIAALPPAPPAETAAPLERTAPAVSAAAPPQRKPAPTAPRTTPPAKKPNAKPASTVDVYKPF